MRRRAFITLLGGAGEQLDSRRLSFLYLSSGESR
jgi:hypothetical protein